MALLRSLPLRGFALLLLLLVALGGRTAAGHMGPSLPLLHPAGEEGRLMGHLMGEYIGEQAGREVRLKEGGGTATALEGVAARIAPLAVVPERGMPPLPPGVALVGPPLPGPGGGWRVAAGEEALGSLSFSLLPQWISRLARGLQGTEWGAEMERVRRGEGARRVALDLLRGRDLL